MQGRRCTAGVLLLQRKKLLCRQLLQQLSAHLLRNVLPAAAAAAV
jgi:hypothetical protein